MERNFSMRKIWASRPTRFCLKKIGPGELSLTAMAISPNKGDRTIKAMSETQKSKARLPKRR